MLSKSLFRLKVLSVCLGVLALAIAAPTTLAQGGFPGGGDSSEPILTIAGYATSPDPVQSEQPFTLTLTVKNIGTKHAEAILASLQNGAFVQIGAPAAVGKLEPGESATVSLTVRAPKDVSGAQSLSILFTYRIGTSGEYSVTRTLGVLGRKTESGVSGKARVVVESAAVLSAPRAVGDAFEVALVFRNIGQRAAYHVNGALKVNEALSPAQGSGALAIGDLAAGQAVTVTTRLVLNQSAPTGRVTQTYALDYRDSASTSYNNDETVSLDLGTAARQRPQLMIAAHSTLPETPAPGDAFTLTVTVQNVGAGAAENVTVRLGGSAGLKPFLPLEAGNVAYAAEIPAQGAQTFTFSLLVDGAATGGAYALDVALDYQNALGESQAEAEVIGLRVVNRPQLHVGLTRPISDSVAVGQTIDLPVEIINIGRQRVDVNTVEITSTDLSLTKNSLYVGPLDASISGGLTAKATTLREGTATYTVVIHYRDDLNQPRTLTYPMTVNVRAAPAFTMPSETNTASAEPASGGFWEMLLRFFGLGG